MMRETPEILEVTAEALEGAEVSNIQVCFTVIFAILLLFIVMDFLEVIKNEKRFKRIEKHIGLGKEDRKE